MNRKQNPNGIRKEKTGNPKERVEFVTPQGSEVV